MDTKKFEGTQKQFDGRDLPKAITYSGEYEAYTSHDEVVAAKDELTNKEVVDFRNAQRLAAAKSKAANDARQKLSDEWKAENPDWEKTGAQNPYEKATIANSESKRFDTMVATLMAAGKSKERAEQIAKMSLEA